MKSLSNLGPLDDKVPENAYHPTFYEAFRFWLKLGFISFGGPAGQIAIMHEELARIDGQELRTPVIQLAAAWEQSGRYTQYGPLMLRMADRSERALIFAPTHEEAIAELARREIVSYRQMPALVYQVHTKYRDEMRVKGGLMRMREFTMLDAYSYDADAAGLDRSYAQVASAFEQIFDRCGVRYVAVEAASGEMGGREPREYMALSQSGEDTLAICANCRYAANVEVAVAGRTTDDGRRTTDGEPRSIDQSGFPWSPDHRSPRPAARRHHPASAARCPARRPRTRSSCCRIARPGDPLILNPRPIRAGHHHRWRDRGVIA
jgi:hypothetical protein